MEKADFFGARGDCELTCDPGIAPELETMTLQRIGNAKRFNASR